MEKARQSYSSNIFEVVIVLEFQQIAGLDVHKGKDPSVELRVEGA